MVFEEPRVYLPFPWWKEPLLYKEMTVHAMRSFHQCGTKHPDGYIEET